MNHPSSPEEYNIKVRTLLSHLLTSNRMGEDDKMLLESAINYSRVSDNVCSKYYVDVRAFLAHLSLTEGRDKMNEFTELFHLYRNSI